jgi:methylthioribose-1-phosphate isomerase
MAAGEQSAGVTWHVFVLTFGGAHANSREQVYNPSFDVTPAELISCVVTEKGVAVNDGGKGAIDLSSVC